VRVRAQTLLAVLIDAGIETVAALKIDVEGMEDTILAPFFSQAPQPLWPRLIIIEDSRPSWSVDLMAMLQQRGYVVAARSRQNFVLRRTPPDAVVPSSGAAMDACKTAR
jgi:hypothetical protein